MISTGKLTTKPNAAGIVTFALLTLGLVAGLQAQESPLTGTWVRNDALSDDVKTVLEQSSSSERKKLDGGLKRFARSIVVFGIPVGQMPMPSGSSTSDDKEAYWESADYLLNDVPEIRILQGDDATQFEYGNDTLFIYEHGATTETDDATIEAAWKRDRFVIEQTLDDGGTILETFQIEPDSQQLVWTVSLKRSKAKTIDIVRTYERKSTGGFNFVEAKHGPAQSDARARQRS
jgi:hypothetical protein